MKRFRQIGFLRILPEYLLIFGLLFGGFSLSGSLAETPVSHTEVAYIELLTEQSASSEVEVKDFNQDTEASSYLPQAPFYSFSFRSFHQTYLIHQVLAREKERTQTQQLYTHSKHSYCFSIPHIPLYSRDDFPIAIPA